MIEEKIEALTSEGRQLGCPSRGVEKTIMTITLIMQDSEPIYYERRREKSDVDCVGIAKVCRLGVCGDEAEGLEVPRRSLLMYI